MKNKTLIFGLLLIISSFVYAAINLDVATNTIESTTDSLRFISNDTNRTLFLSETSDAEVQLAPLDWGAALYLYSDDGDYALIQKLNETSSPSKAARFYSSDDIVLMPNADGNDYFKFSTVADVNYFEAIGNSNVRVNDDFIPYTDNSFDSGIASLRWADTRTVLLNGADICFENNICMTECVNELNQMDICFIYGKPNQNQANLIALYYFETWDQYLNETNNQYNLTESEYNQYYDMITIDGKPDFTFNRQTYGSLRQIDKYIREYIAMKKVLINKGILTQSEIDAEL